MSNPLSSIPQEHVLTPAMQVANTKVLTVSISSFLPSFSPYYPCVCKALCVSLSGARLQALNTKYASLKNEIQNSEATLKSLKRNKADHEREIKRLNGILKPPNFYYPGIDPDTIMRLQAERNQLVVAAQNEMSRFSARLHPVNLAIESTTKKLSRAKAKLFEVEQQLASQSPPKGFFESCVIC